MVEMTENNTPRKEEANPKRFFRRLLYKFSGQKVIGFLISASAILLLVWFNKLWNTSEAVTLKAIEAIRALGIALFAVKGVQNGIGMVTDYVHRRNNHESVEKSYGISKDEGKF